jgi:methylated-DNA-[protein]-cysteine S-methyltransferase
MKLYQTFYDSPVGRLVLIASDRGLRALLWQNEKHHQIRLQKTIKDHSHAILLQTGRQLDEYFSGQRKKFDVALDPQGTPFQLRVWETLRKIPFGKTLSYGEQAHLIGQPTAARAVGTANGKNPISIIVPCHRVIGKNGHLTGFGGGLVAKKKLLEIEGAL